MKKLYFFMMLIAVAAVSFTACQKEVNDTSVVDPDAIQITVKAVPEEIKTEDGSKTYIDNTNTIRWGTGEYMKLALTAGETTTFATSTDASADTFDGQASATFEFSVTPATASKYVYQGLYPASATTASNNTNAANYKVNLPAIQNATASSYDPAAYIMVAKPESFASVQTDWEASFRRGTALNKITLKNFASSVEINKVKITAEGKKLAGGRHFNLTTGEGLEVYGTDASIDVLYATPLSGTSMDVWFTSWDTEIAEGEKLTIIAYTTDNKSYTKEITVPTGKSIKFQEGYLNTLGAKFDGIDPVNVSSLDGDYVILAENSGNYYALKGEASGTRIASVDYSGSTSSYTGDASLIWTIATSGSGYTIKNGSNFIGWTSGNYADLVAEASYDATKCLMGIDDNGDGTYKIYVAADATRILARNQSNAYFAFYTGSGYKDLILVPATAMEQVATPTFSPVAGEVASGDQVTISCATSGATIHYTVDGTDPTSSSATYSSPIEITATTTIKAIAVKDGMADSEIATATYTVASAGSVTLTASDITAGDNTVQGTNNSALAYRLGTSSNNGSLTFPAGYSSITFTLAGWASGTRSFSITNGTISGSASLSPDAGSPSGTINAGFSTTYTGTEYTIDVTDPSQEVVFSGRRCVVWGFTAVAGASVTWNLESIAITTAPTKTTYTAGQTFDPAGMVVTGHFVDADDATNTKDEAVTGYTITPDGALSVSDTQVTITYQGKTATQDITVSAAPVVTYDFETVAELNALANSGGEKNGYLTGAVVSYVNGKSAIIKDATGSVLLYKDNHNLLQGQTFTGALTVTITQYNSCSELTACDASFTGTGTAVAPENVTLAQLVGNLATYQNAYVKVDNLTVTAVSGKNITVTDDGGVRSYVIYSSSADATCSAGDVLSVVGTIAHYGDNDQIKAWATSDITVTASAPKAITFSQPAAGGSFTVKVDGNTITSGTTVAAGKTVTLTATVASGYTFNGWSVTGATVADASAATTTFTMGTSAVAVSASFTDGSTSGPSNGDVLFSTDFGSSAVALDSFTGGTSYNDASTITYTASNATYVKIDTGTAGNMTSANLFIGGKNGGSGLTATISGIKTYGATSVTVTWAANNANSKVSVTESSSAAVTSASSASNSATFTLSGTETTITLVFTGTSKSNTRVDDVSVVYH